MTQRLRTCVGCRTRRPASEMVRLVRRSDGVVVPRSGVGPAPSGRSVHLCPCRRCFDRAIRGNALVRGLARSGRTRVEPASLWPAITTAVEADLDVLRRCAGHTPSPRIEVLERQFAALRGGPTDG